MFRTIIYTSSAAPGFTVRDLERVLSVSRANNAQWHLTGVLLFEGGTFLQVVEGPVWPVQKALERIERDDRHSGLEVLADFKTTQRHFPGWTMGSRELDGEAAFTRSEAEMEARLHPEAPAVIRVMIKTFFLVTGYSRGKAA